MPCQKNNPCDKKKLTLFCDIARFLYPKNDYSIKNIYLDYGADMRWETVVCERNSDAANFVDSYQMLNPADWDRIHGTDDLHDLTNVMIDIIERQSNLLGRAK